MTDRELLDDIELLELAAKAADIYETLHQTEDGFEFIWSYVIWNPLTDDGDALRLAVKLKIDFKIRNEVTWWDRQESDGVVYWGHEPHNNDPLAATRRAIVRAAAEIGRRMT